MGPFQVLNKPYPTSSDLGRSIWFSFYVGCFVAFFLNVFQPFGIQEWQHPHKMAFLIGYGVVCFWVSALYIFISAFIVSKSKAEEHWTVGKEIISITGLLLLITFGNLFYSVFIGVASIDISTALYFMISTLLVSIFPVVVSVLTKHKQFLKLNQKQAVLINQEIQLFHADDVAETNIVLTGETDKERVSLTLDQLLYIESADNYSKIVYMKGQEQQQTLIRSTLKRLEYQKLNMHILRCHRTYMVNLLNIKDIEGNAQGYKLHFFKTSDVVPVSRNFAPAILEKLKALKTV